MTKSLFHWIDGKVACFIFSVILTCSARADSMPAVASINLCTDRLVLALADKDQIVSLSYVAADSNSMIRTAAAKTDLNHGALEELLALDVDYILASEFDDARLLTRLREFGNDVRQFTAARTLDQAKQNISLMAKLLNQHERGALMIEELDGIHQLDKFPGKPRTLLLGANNYISGKNSLASSVIEAMGYRNIADEVSVSDYGRVSMEQIIDLKPRVIIVSKYSDDYSRAQSVLQHPVLQHLSSKVTVISVPTREWICGDRALVQAATRLMPQQN